MSSLKAKVESVTGAPAQMQELSLGSTLLTADTSTLGAYGVVSGSTLDLVLTDTPPAVAAVVHVALPLSLQSTHGTTLTFGFDPSSDTVSGLKAKIEVQTGLAAAEQATSFAAMSLDASPGDSLLSSFGVVAGSTIYCDRSQSLGCVAAPLHGAHLAAGLAQQHVRLLTDLPRRISV